MHSWWLPIVTGNVHHGSHPVKSCLGRVAGDTFGMLKAAIAQVPAYGPFLFLVRVCVVFSSPRVAHSLEDEGKPGSAQAKWCSPVSCMVPEL